MDEIFFEDSLLVHFLDQRTNLLVGKLADVVAKQDFVVGKGGQRRWGWGLERGLGHANTFETEDSKP